MRTIFVLFDSLNRAALGAYGGTAVKTPNFDRFAARAVTFDSHYVGSLPCMPARRDMHGGRLNFTHRSWGPLEPFDNSFAEIMKRSGVYTHLITDHLHYFEDGGHGFHTRFSSYDFIRGQEYDPWVAMVKPPLDCIREKFDARHYNTEKPDKRMQHAINRDRLLESAAVLHVRHSSPIERMKLVNSQLTRITKRRTPTWPSRPSACGGATPPPTRRASARGAAPERGGARPARAARRRGRAPSRGRRSTGTARASGRSRMTRWCW